MTLLTVAKAMDLLNLFSAQRVELGVTEIARILEISKATAHGLASTLAEGGFLQQNRVNKKYCLGVKIFELGLIQPSTMQLNQKAAGVVHELSRSQRATCRVAIWDMDAILVTMTTTFPPEKSVLVGQIGPRLHAYCSSLGKAVLAFLDDETLKTYLDKIPLTKFTPRTITDRELLLEDLEIARARGYAMDAEEAVLGMTCLGGPVFDHEGMVIGSVSLSGSPEKFAQPKKLEKFGFEVMKAAAQVSRLLGYRPEALGVGSA